ncbi:MAG: ubiquinone/menaquinone biosynthesis methyltransferase [Polyangiaceae bacterium]
MTRQVDSAVTTVASAAPLGSGAMFDAIAPRYDLLNRLISLGIDRRWRRLAASALELGEIPSTRSSSVLDLATGTADLAIEIASSSPRTRVFGVDPSAAMLEVGKRKVAARSLADRVVFSVGRAEELAFDDEVFDGVTIAFGIRNVPDRPAGLREMARVTRTGGRVVILELSEPPPGLLGAMARLHVHHLVPFVGGLLSGSREYRYLQRSIAAFPPAADFARIIDAAGLDVLRVEPLTFGVAT